MRKTSNKVLLALFNIIGDVEGKAFLDLFSGSGQIAEEAWKRGARPVVAVESDRMLCTKLRRLAEDKESFEVFCMDVRRALPSLSKRGYKFSLIFADPPYEHGWIKRLLLLLAKYEALLMHDALLVFERSRREKLPLHCKAWKLLKERSYGDTVLSLFKLDLGPRAEVE
ncbi:MULTISPECIES: RsmD family RNA methyltransferase [Acetomicrobium]|uniref:RsmD family RNA methyltransferase n=1 Tax=Acetomicrobium TaxID=49894 RepID=UPI0026F265FB|nr:MULTISPECIES: RsmD family RNA methyltransferase [Acetomicrobium]MDR9770975.1 RsmD family RNA methyltransferase [Acetomicrobium sp.]HOB10039.1 RsmD family RNA methyltransferase [Acetomicrobium sp.]HOM97804.1 RsmD family RNA methyltransferase [Acetomicrobium sp.]HQA35817.1 RsmD family RNA methyltransferase [Acetomicrobium sp.]HQC87555.1 RsmD family RNA methyltransferase [Acetomicrobium sp.]